MSHLSSPPGFRSDLARALRVGFLAGCLGGCAPPSPSSDDAPAAHDAGEAPVGDADAISIRSPYLSIEEALPGSSAQRWADLRARLFAQFDEICGDTFCEGDWSNLEPLDLACSVSTKRGAVRECVWTFAASAEEVEAAGGTIAASIPTFACRFRPRSTASQLLGVLRDDPLGTPVPGTTESIYDLLGECFESPSGAVDLSGETLDGPYVDVRVGLDDETIDAWYTMTSALRAAYADSVEGEPGAPQPLRLVCSMDENNRQIGTCAWIFAGATPVRKPDGFHRVEEERHVCAFTARATPAELAAALAPLPTANLSPLDRPLPGGELTLRDVLDACL